MAGKNTAAQTATQPNAAQENRQNSNVQQELTRATQAYDKAIQQIQSEKQPKMNGPGTSGNSAGTVQPGTQPIVQGKTNTQTTQQNQLAQDSKQQIGQLRNAWASASAPAAMQNAAQRINTAMQGRQTKATATAQPSAQTKQNASTTQEATGGIYQVQPNGQAPKGLKVGDQVVTGGGTYTITGVNADGTYTSKLTNKDQTTGNYTGQYATVGATPAAAPATAAQPQQPQHAQGFDPNVDYEAEIQKAVQAGNLGAAAILEQMRNAKIEAMGLQNQYALTNTYEQYLGQVSPEYAAQLQSGYTRDTSALTKNPYDEMYGYVDQWKANEEQRQTNQIDYTTQQGITELERARDDAQPEFDKQLKQLDADTARAMANSAFYAEARGDRGGIGQSQYNEVQASALQNKQAIETARTKLATDTARQIADLRAQGEFKKADALLQVAQQALTQLMSLKQSGAEYALQVEQMQQEIDQALRNFSIQEAQLTGVYNGQPTLSAQKADQENALSLLGMLMQYGVPPSEALLKAAGYDAYSGDVSGLISAIKASNFSSGGSGGGGSSGSGAGTLTGLPGTYEPWVDNTATEDKAKAAAELTGNKGRDMTGAVTGDGYLSDYTTIAAYKDRWSALESEANGGMSKKDQRALLQQWLNSGKINAEAYGQMVEAYGLNTP